MTTESRKAEEVQPGDMVHFPNSRKAQRVTFAGRRNDGDAEQVVLEAGDGATQWVLGHGVEVNVEVPDESTS